MLMNLLRRLRLHKLFSKLLKRRRVKQSLLSRLNRLRKTALRWLEDLESKFTTRFQRAIRRPIRRPVLIGMETLEDRQLLATGTVTSVSASALTLTAGQSEVLTATISSLTGSATAIDSGTVQFYDNGTALGSAQTVTQASGSPNGTASLSTASLGAGTHVLTAQYSGNSTFSASNSATYPTFDGSTNYVNQPATGLSTFSTGFTASVWAYPTAVSNWARFFDLGGQSQNISISRNGTSNDLRFYVGGTQLFVSNAISLNSWQLFSVTVDASGNTTVYKNGQQLATTQNAGFIPSTAVRTSNYIAKSNWADALYQGQMHDLQIYNTALTAAQVSSVYSSGTASTPTFNAPAALASNVVSTAMTSSATVTVNKATSTTTLATSAAASTFGTSVTFTATVSSATASASANASFIGTDTATQGSWHNVYGIQGYSIPNISTNIPTSLGTLSVSNALLYNWANPTTDVRATQDPTNFSSRASECWYTHAAANSGSDSTYSMTLNLTDGNTHKLSLYAQDWGTDNKRTESISLTDTATGTVLDTESLATFSNGIYLQWNVKGNVTISVTCTGPTNAVINGLFLDSSSYVFSNVLATGTVTFKDGSNTLGTGTVTNGTATYTTAALTGGSHSITAVYGGDGNFSGSTSTAVSQTVNKTSSTTTLTTSATTSTYGTSVTFTATLPNGATGTVTFKDGSTTLGTGTVTNSTASYTTSTLIVGNHNISAVYGGDGNYLGSNGYLGSKLTPGNAGFETPDLGSGDAAWTYRPSNASWNFTGYAGIAANNCNFTMVAANNGNPDGTKSTSGQAALLHYYNDGTQPGTMSQGLTFAADTIATFYFSIEQWPYGTSKINLLLDATDLGTYSTTSTSAFVAMSTPSIAVTAGTHTLTFQIPNQGTNNSTDFVDDVFYVTGGQTVNQASSTSTLATSAATVSYGTSVTFTATVPSGATGTVTFKDGTSTLGTGTVSGTTATFTSSTLTTGAHSITAVYGGDGNYTGSTSSAVAQTVNKATSTTTLATLAATVTYGTSVTFTATVTNGATGTVTFKDGTTTLGTGTIIGTTATFTSSTLTPGAHSITAVYGGDSNFTSSTSSAVAQTVNQATSSTTLATSAATVTYGTSVTFTATVTDGATGTVTFKDGSTTLGTGTISGTKATYTTATLTGGSHSITAAYVGDGNYQGSTSSALTQTVNTASSTTTLATSAATSTYGTSVTFTATVPSGTTGTVTFKDGSTTLGTGTISGTTATFTSSSITAGAHSITAVYGGDGNYTGSTSSAVAQTVNQATSSTTLATSAATVTYGTSVTFTATVTSGVTGTVTFKDGTATLGTGTISGTTATFTSSSISTGSHSITAVYGGDSNYIGSTSSAVAQTVNQASSTTSLASSANPNTYRTSVTFTATVPSGATGTVTFKDSTTILGTGNIINGSATISISTLTGGNHSISAVYAGDGNYTGSTSSTLSQTVSKASTTTTLVTSAATVNYGASVTFTATVPSGATGTITFKDGTTTLAAGNITNGTATYSSTTLSVGISHSITAVYGGDGNFQGSTSTAVAQAVNKASSTTTLATSTDSVANGSSITFTATVTRGATGTVQFYDGGAALGSAAAIAGGTATYSTSSLASGAHSITATYSGDTTYNISSSVALSQAVTSAPVVTTQDGNTTVDVGPNQANAGALDITNVAASVNSQQTQVLQFNGTSSVVTLPKNILSDFTKGFSAGLWVYPTAATGTTKIFDFGSSAGNDNISLGFDSNLNLKFSVWKGTTEKPLTATSAITLNTWQYLAVVLGTDGSATLYKNGKSIATSTLAVPNNVTRANGFVGRSNTAADSWFQGQMSSLSLWNTPLTSAQVTAAQSTVYTGSESGLVGFWPMNVATSNTTVIPGQTVTLRATASGYPIPTVQWFSSTDSGTTWSSVPGATNTTYSFSAANGDNGKQFKAQFTNSAGTSYSTPVPLVAQSQTVVDITYGSSTIEFQSETYFTKLGSTFSTTGKAYLGFKPSAGQSFVKVLCFDGGVGVDTDKLTFTAGGKLSVAIVSPAVPLMDGAPATINIKDLVDNNGAGLTCLPLTVGSTTLTVTSMKLVASDDKGVPGIVVGGGLTLPVTGMPVTGEVTIDQNGVRITKMNKPVTSWLINGFKFDTTGLTTNYDSATHVYTATGQASVSVPLLGNMIVTLGEKAKDGTVLSTGLRMRDGVIENLDMTVDGMLGFAGVSLTAENLNVTYVASQNQFTMTGTASLFVAAMGNVEVKLGKTATDGTVLSRGLVVKDGALQVFDMTIDSNMRVGGGQVLLQAENLNFTYLNGSAPATAVKNTNSSGTSTTPQTTALTLDGTSGYVQLPSVTANFSTGLTAGIWVYPTGSIGNNNTFFDFGNGDGVDNIRLSRSGITSDLQFTTVVTTTTTSTTGSTATSTPTSTTTVLTAKNAIEQNKWQYFSVVMQANGSTTLYKNGQSIATGAVSVPANLTRTKNYLGRSNTDGDALFTGQLSNFGLWNTPLTAAQVNSSMTSTTPVTTTGLVGFWKMTDTAKSTSVIDAGAGALNGTDTALPATYAMSGTASIYINTIGYVSVKMGQFDASGNMLKRGLVVQGNDLKSLDLTVNGDIRIGTVLLHTENLNFTYTSSTDTFTMSGTAAVEIEALGIISVTLGDKDPFTGLVRSKGLVVTAGKFVSMDMTVDGVLNVGEVVMAAKELNFTYVASTDTFTLTGTAAVAMEGVGAIEVTLGKTGYGTGSYGGISYGMVVQHGKLKSLDMDVTANVQIQNVMLVVYKMKLTFESETDTWTMTGTAGLAVFPFGIIAVTLGKQALDGTVQSQGMVVTHGHLVKLDMTVNAGFVLEGVAFTARNLNFTYTTATDTFTMQGTAILVAGLPGFSGGAVDVTLGQVAQNGQVLQQGLVITHGKLVSLDVTLMGSVTIDMVTSASVPIPIRPRTCISITPPTPTPTHRGTAMPVIP